MNKQPVSNNTIELWCSYVGRGAPSNAAGNRTGLGATKIAAHESAGHWANQAPYARTRRIVLTDSGMSLGDEHIARRYFERLIDAPAPTSGESEALRILAACDWSGGWASAWRAANGEPS